MKLRDIIIRKIKERGMTLDEVAKQITSTRKDASGEPVKGISQPSMSSLLNGNPTFTRLQEIAGILGISVSELVADEDDTHTTIICPHCGKELKIVKADADD